MDGRQLGQFKATQMDVKRCVWLFSTLILVSNRGLCACITKGVLTVCPDPIILYPNRNTRFEIICDGRMLPGKLNAITISKIKGDDERLVSNYISSFPSGNALRPSSTAPIVNRSLINGDATSLKFTITSAIIDDLICSYECDIQSQVRDSGWVNKSSIDVSAGAYPRNVNLSVSPIQSISNKDVITLNCEATSGLFRQDRGESVSDYHFQYLDQDQWITIDSDANESDQRISLSERTVDGIFVSRTYSIKLAVESIPKCCRRYLCYLSFRGHDFTNLTSDQQVCLNPGEGNCPLSQNRTIAIIISVVSLSVFVIVVFVFIKYLRWKEEKRLSDKRRRNSERKYAPSKQTTELVETAPEGTSMTSDLETTQSRSSLADSSTISIGAYTSHGSGDSDISTHSTNA